MSPAPRVVSVQPIPLGVIYDPTRKPERPVVDLQIVIRIRDTVIVMIPRRLQCSEQSFGAIGRYKRAGYGD